MRIDVVRLYQCQITKIILNIAKIIREALFRSKMRWERSQYLAEMQQALTNDNDAVVNNVTHAVNDELDIEVANGIFSENSLTELLESAKLANIPLDQWSDFELSGLNDDDKTMMIEDGSAEDDGMVIMGVGKQTGKIFQKAVRHITDKNIGTVIVVDEDTDNGRKGVILLGQNVGLRFEEEEEEETANGSNEVSMQEIFEQQDGLESKSKELIMAIPAIEMNTTVEEQIGEQVVKEEKAKKRKSRKRKKRRKNKKEIKPKEEGKLENMGQEKGKQGNEEEKVKKEKAEKKAYTRAQKLRKPAALPVVERAEVKDPQYQCETCGKGFRTSPTLYAHVQTHNPQYPFQCKHCPLSFDKITPQHEMVHTGQSTCECSFCFKSFRTNTACKRHNRAHPNKKEYKCNLCSKTFLSNPCWRLHQQIHVSLAEPKQKQQQEQQEQQQQEQQQQTTPETAVIQPEKPKDTNKENISSAWNKRSQYGEPHTFWKYGLFY